MTQPVAAVPLACPGCARLLVGRPCDAVLICPSCGLGRELSPASGAPLPVRFAELPAGAGVAAADGAREAAAGPALPFWRFESRAAGSVPAGWPEPLPATAFVLAARIRKFHVYGDPGLEYTRRPPRLGTGPALPLVPIARTREDAGRVLRMLLLRLASEAGAAAAPDLEAANAAAAAYGEPSLWCVPTLVDGHHLKLPHCPIRFPRDLVEGVASARRE